MRFNYACIFQVFPLNILDTSAGKPLIPVAVRFAEPNAVMSGEFLCTRTHTSFSHELPVVADILMQMYRYFRLFLWFLFAYFQHVIFMRYDVM